MPRLLPVALLGLLLASGCASTQHRAATSPLPQANPAAVAANDNLNAVAWTQLAIERDLIYQQTYHAAQQRLLAALQDPSWDALPHDERHNDVRALKPAVIVDIDETVLDNSPYQARLVHDNLQFDEATWADWCREGTAKALPGAVAFTRFAADHGITVFYLSNRAHDLDQVSLQNLRSEGFPVASDENVFLGLGSEIAGCQSRGSDKGCRRQHIARNYRVLMQFGDQIGDFLNVHPNTVVGRRDLMQPYLSWIGERWFVLPNPTYGSWEPALFGNDWKLSVEQRRRAKRDALRLK